MEYIGVSIGILGVCLCLLGVERAISKMSKKVDKAIELLEAIEKNTTK